MKKATASDCRDPENRSDKPCACGGHQGKRGKKPRGKKGRERQGKGGRK